MTTRNSRIALAAAVCLLLITLWSMTVVDPSEPLKRSEVAMEEVRLSPGDATLAHSDAERPR